MTKGRARNGSKPAGKKRRAKGRIKDRYAHAREDAQLAGLIPTSPEESLTPERVDPATQGNAVLPGIVREALRNDWTTPDIAKPVIVAALLEPFYTKEIRLDKDGNQVEIKPKRELLIECAKTLKSLDQTQFERNNPVEAGKAKGGGVSVGVGVTVIDWGALPAPKIVDPVDEAIKGLSNGTANGTNGNGTVAASGGGNEVPVVKPLESLPPPENHTNGKPTNEKPD